MTYKPKEDEDAITRNRQKAVFVNFEPNDRNPYIFKIDGVPCLYSPSGRRFLAGDDRSCDLVGKWEDPQPKKKAKKLKWAKVAKGLTVAGGYDIAKRDVDFELTYFDMESRGNTYLGIFPTKKAAKAAAQEDADKL